MILALISKRFYTRTEGIMVVVVGRSRYKIERC
jgi:hypothetical protein